MEQHQQRQGDHARGLWNLIVLSEWLEWAAMAHRGGTATAAAAARPCRDTHTVVPMPGAFEQGSGAGAATVLAGNHTG